MSLFATDPALLRPREAAAAPTPPHATPAHVPAPAAAPMAAIGAAAPAVAPWQALLPALVDGALRRGHVRAAALLAESAAAMASDDGDSLTFATQLIDTVAAVDAALQRRQLAGEAVLVPSLVESAPGLPRFAIGLTFHELALPAVRDFVEGELGDGHDAELRTFLDQLLAAGDVYLDLAPGAGAALLTAATHPARPKAVAWCAEAALTTVLVRNVHAAGAESQVQVVSGHATPEAIDARAGARTIIHVGTDASLLRGGLTRWSVRPTVIAFRTGAATTADTMAALDAAGFECFALTAAMELVPLVRAPRASVGFALSPACSAQLEAAA